MNKIIMRKLKKTNLDLFLKIMKNINYLYKRCQNIIQIINKIFFKDKQSKLNKKNKNLR